MGAFKYEGKLIHNRKDIGDIEIQREKPYAIPHIKGKTFKDALYGLGYVQAQDRLFSMHIKRRLSQGRLSEFGGEKTVETDMFFRTVGISNTIKQVAKNMDQETKERAQAFINGINDYVDSLPMLPLEFQIIGEKFEPWTIEDCVSIELMLNLFLSLDFFFEPLKDVVREKYGIELTEQIFAMKDENLFDKTYTLNDDDLKQSNIYQKFTEEDLQIHIKHLREKHKVDKTQMFENYMKMSQIEYLEHAFSQLKGSNIWAVDGHLTKSGKPLLANDPHLDIIIPSIWYQAEILFEHEGKKRYAIGASVAGMPCIILGKTNYAAWGITNNMSDSTDLYIEKIEGDKYFHDGKWIQMKARKEIIKIGKSGDFKEITVYETHHGPVLPNMLDLCELDKPKANKDVYSLSWPGNQVKNNLIQSNQKIILSENIKEFQQALRDTSDPVVNIVYATEDGHIGHMSMGRIPVRHDPLNCFPLDGTNHENDWIRYYTGEEQPQVIDPKKHYLVNANNKVATDNLVHHITSTSTTMARAYRITTLLKEYIKKGIKFEAKDFQNFQQDRVDQYCLDTRDDLLKIFEIYGNTYFRNQTEQAKIQQIHKSLQNWNCNMAVRGPDSEGAAIYGVWEQKMLIKFFHNLSDDMYLNNRAAMNLMFDHFFFKHLQYWAKGQNLHQHYCSTKDNQDSDKNCIYNFFQAVLDTHEFLSEKFPGQPSQNWQWGKINAHEFRHSPFSDTPLKPFFGKTREGGGNRRTINVGGVNLALDMWKSVYSANFRSVFDFDPNGKSYYIIDTGTSESIFSEHYTDQLDLFQDGKYLEMEYGHDKFGKYKYSFSSLVLTNNQTKSDL